MTNQQHGDGNVFVPHDVVWDERKIARYWDHLSNVPQALDNCWSKQVGKALVRYVLRRRPLKGRVLDYGCGPGFLINELLETASEATIYGVEHSPVSMELVNRQFAQRERFRGVASAATVPTPFQEGYFDTVFFVETIEHVEPAQRLAALRELRRLLKPNGLVVVTTPNEEDIEASKAICPDCGARFHVVQHVSSWSANTLRSTMEEVGFRTVSCGPTRLRPRRSVLGLLKDRLNPGRLPHLIYLGVAA